MNRIEGQLAFVLHTRPYRDTSVLVDLFTEEQGRIRAVARGGRRPGSRWRALLQPFVPLLAGWQGRAELKSLVQLESAAPPLSLPGQALWCGLYLNELLMRLLVAEDPHPELYAYYRLVLGELTAGDEIEPLLRLFERRTVAALGYGFAWDREAQSDHPLSPGGWYRFHPESGFFRVEEAQAEAAAYYRGADLLAIASDDYQQDSARRAAKRVMRQALAPLLGDRPLKSRALFTMNKPARRDAVAEPQPSQFYSGPPAAGTSRPSGEKLPPQPGRPSDRSDQSD